MESRSAVTPPSAGPAIEPAPVAARANPIASPRLPGGARSETSASAAIQLAADPTPWIARPSIRRASDSEAAITAEPAAASSNPRSEEPSVPASRRAARGGARATRWAPHRLRRRRPAPTRSPRPALDLGEQGGDQPEQRGVDRHRGNRDRDDCAPAREGLDWDARVARMVTKLYCTLAFGHPAAASGSGSAAGASRRSQSRAASDPEMHWTLQPGAAYSAILRRW